MWSWQGGIAKVAAGLRAALRWGRETLLEGAWLRRDPLPSRPLVVVAAAVAAGIVAAMLVAMPVIGCWITAVAALALWWRSARLGRVAAAAYLLLAIASTAAGWTTARWRLFAADDLAWSLGDRPAPVAVEGRIVSAPRPLPRASDPLRGGGRPPSSDCMFEVTAVRDGVAWRRCSGRAVVVIAGPPPEVAAGTRCRVWGRALRPASPGNPGEFDQRARARQERALSVIRVEGDGIERLAAAAWPAATARLEGARERGAAALRRHLSAERGPLATALLLGTREALLPETTESFMVTGTVHILSISGLHVALLAAGLFAIARFFRLSRGATLVTVSVATGLYMLLVGGETPVLRATLLVWLACLGIACGRRATGINALAAVGIVILAWHPPEILRIGSQLSFLSTAVLIGAATAVAARRRDDDPIERLIDRSRSEPHRWLRRRGRDAFDALLIGAAVWLATAPLVARHFHVFSPVGLFLNPLIAPLVGVAMVGGFVCLLAAPICWPVAAAGGMVCDGALAGVEFAVGATAGIPGAFHWVAGPPMWWTTGWYVGIVAVLLWGAVARLGQARTWAAAAALWVGVGLLITPLAARPVPALEVIAASMGHGCGLVVRGPAGQCLVYDAGRLGAGVAAGRGLSAVLWSEGIGTIHTLVISHADTDHFNGVPDILDRFEVGRVVVPEAFLASRSPAVVEILARFAAARIPVSVASAGDEIPFDPLCRVRVLHPRSAAVPAAATDNESSLVVSVESAGRRVLLTGDLEGGALDRFVATGPGRCDVLVAPHHGSPASLPPVLARATTPRWVIVSGAAGPRFDEVRLAYATAAGADRPARVLRTEGAIRLRLTAAGTEGSQFLDGRWQAVAPPGSATVPTAPPP
jgi:competence protein ComEC